ncbi:MAG TPA: hypothetical protein VHU85_01390 [Acidimicrobiales bacterium]|nr:hypothetical protein [Acidimicrobiales bacterium]
MTDDIAVRLRTVGPDYRSWTEAADLSMVADIVGRPLGTLQPEPVGLGRREELSRMMGAATESAGEGALDPARQASPGTSKSSGCSASMTARWRRAREGSATVSRWGGRS